MDAQQQAQRCRVCGEAREFEHGTGDQSGLCWREACVKARTCGLRRERLYRIPACAVSYHPSLAGARVWWTGQIRVLPAGGGLMAEFTLPEGRTWQGASAVWLRPFAVVEG